MGNKRVVHIVDDEETIRKALSFTLRTAGFAVEAYASGPEFLLSAEDAEKGCVVLDMHMPDMDGLQVQAELTRRGIDMPVVVLTGNGDPTLAVQAMKAGAADFLAKPVDADQITAALLEKDRPLPPPPEDPMSADRVRWEHIQRVYEQCGRNVSETARRLNMHRRTLQRILNKRAPQESKPDES